MKPREKRQLLALGAGVGLLLLLVRRAKAASGARGEVHIGPVTVEQGPALTEAQRLAWPRLQLAIDQAKNLTAFDEDVGPQRDPGPEGRTFIDGAIRLWKQVEPSTPPDLLVRLRDSSRGLPTSDLLARTTARVRQLTGWNPEWGTVHRTPTPAEAEEIRKAIELWQTHSQTAGDYLQLLLDDALSLSRS